METIRSRERSVPSRGLPVGFTTLLGGIALASALAINVAMGQLGLSAGRDDPASFEYYLSNVPLLVGWGLLFVASVLRLRDWSERGRLWRVGAAWTAVGFGAATAGFVGVVASLPLGGMPASNLANMVAGMSMLFGVGPGTFLLGLGSLSDPTVSRYAASVLAVSGAAFVGFFLLGGIVPQTVADAMFLQLPVAWTVFGHARWTTDRRAAIPATQPS